MTNKEREAKRNRAKGLKENAHIGATACFHPDDVIPVAADVLELLAENEKLQEENAKMKNTMAFASAIGKVMSGQVDDE